MASLKETLKKNPAVLGAVVLMVVVFGLMAYSTISKAMKGNEPPKEKLAELTPQTKKEIGPNGSAVSTDGSQQGRKIVQVLPTGGEAKTLQRETLTDQGRYASPIDEDALPLAVQKKKPVVVTNAQNASIGQEQDERNMELKRLWAKFNKVDRNDGGLLSNEKSKSQGANGDEQSAGSTGPFKIPYYKFVKARLQAESNSLETGVPVIAEVTDPRFPSGTQIVGAASPNLKAYRLNTKFTRLRMADGHSYKVNAIAYSIDETPGIASVVERRDIKGAVISTVFATAKGFANAFRKDATTTVLGLGTGTIAQQTNPGGDRLREGLTGGMEEGANKAGSLIDRELEKDAYQPVVIAEKGLPILVMFTEDQQ